MVAATLRFLEGTGAWVIYWIQAAYAVLRLIGTALAWIFGGWLFGQPVRFSSICLQVVELGVKALPVTALFAVSFGSIIGLQVTLYQKTVDFLPPILEFVGTFFVREQAPAIMGILMAARAGGAITAELSTMVFDREIMALRSIGIDPIRFLIAPSLVAMLIVTPVLGLLMAAGQVLTLSLYLFYAKGIAPVFAIDLVSDGISGIDLTMNVIKGVFFGAAILGISAQAGLTVIERGRTTGSATTFAIVVSIVVVLIINSIISMLFPK